MSEITNVETIAAVDIAHLVDCNPWHYIAHQHEQTPWFKKWKVSCSLDLLTDVLLKLELELELEPDVSTSSHSAQKNSMSAAGATANMSVLQPNSSM